MDDAVTKTSIDECLVNEDNQSNEFEKLILSLPTEEGWFDHEPVYFYKGFWSAPFIIAATRSFLHNFQAQDSDIILATMPKSGTTWLKALTFAIVNRSNIKDHDEFSLHFRNPHDLVPHLETRLYAYNQVPDFSRFQQPRLFATHLPCTSLPESIKNTTTCKIVYMCRNPLDTFVSSWHFSSQIGSYINKQIGSMDDAFDKYCRGVEIFGPFWDHVLGYWQESLARPDKVLFLKYEEMMEDTTSHVKRLASFLGFPFSMEEERDGVIGEIIKLCSFEYLKDLEVNKNGVTMNVVQNKSFFRKGQVGDWTNYLTPSMAQHLTSVVEQRLVGSGLTFN